MISCPGMSSTCSITLTFWPDAVDEGDDQVEAGFGGERVLAEPFDGIDIALPHDAHAHQQENEPTSSAMAIELAQAVHAVLL